MSKKTLTFEEAEEQHLELKAQASAAWAKVNDYKRKHKLKPGYKPEKDKIGKGYLELVAAHRELKESREAAEKAAKALKPASAKGGRKAGVSELYDYPDGATSEEKKKFRQAARAAKKKAEKAENAGTVAPKAKKKAEPVEEPAAKPAKKKILKKKKVVAEDED